MGLVEIEKSALYILDDWFIILFPASSFFSFSFSI